MMITFKHNFNLQFKKKCVEQSSKVLENRIKKLEGELPNVILNYIFISKLLYNCLLNFDQFYQRPLELMAMKYINQAIDHLPIRYSMYRNKLDISFATLTLNLELEEHKVQYIF